MSICDKGHKRIDAQGFALARAMSDPSCSQGVEHGLDGVASASTPSSPKSAEWIAYQSSHGVGLDMVVFVCQATVACPPGGLSGSLLCDVTRDTFECLPAYSSE